MNLGSTLESWATLTLASWNKHNLRFTLSLKERKNSANLIQFFKFCQGIGSFLSSNFFMFIGVILSDVTCGWNHVRVIVFIYSDFLLYWCISFTLRNDIEIKTYHQVGIHRLTASFYHKLSKWLLLRCNNKYRRKLHLWL